MHEGPVRSDLSSPLAGPVLHPRYRLVHVVPPPAPAHRTNVVLGLGRSGTQEDKRPAMVIAIGRALRTGLARALEPFGHFCTLIEQQALPSLHLTFELIQSGPQHAARLLRDFVFPEQVGTRLDATGLRAATTRQHQKYLG